MAGVGKALLSSSMPLLIFHAKEKSELNFCLSLPSEQTAFGIMLGTVSSLIFQRVPDKPGITGLNWRSVVLYRNSSTISAGHKLNLVLTTGSCSVQRVFLPSLSVHKSSLHPNRRDG